MVYMVYVHNYLLSISYHLCFTPISNTRLCFLVTDSYKTHLFGAKHFYFHHAVRI
ncbi:hypothetical protein N665_4037s0001 [Sinapis alba]|nr:hypothetical protein N665_4037s0001 [Sinapis alba]